MYNTNHHFNNFQISDEEALKKAERMLNDMDPFVSDEEALKKAERMLGDTESFISDEVALAKADLLFRDSMVLTEEERIRRDRNAARLAKDMILRLEGASYRTIPQGINRKSDRKPVEVDRLALKFNVKKLRK